MKLITAVLVATSAFGCASVQPCEHKDLGFRLTARQEMATPRSSLLPEQIQTGQLIRVTVHNPGPARTVKLDCNGMPTQVLTVPAEAEATVLYRVAPQPGQHFSCDAS